VALDGLATIVATVTGLAGAGQRPAKTLNGHTNGNAVPADLYCTRSGTVELRSRSFASTCCLRRSALPSR
jgi:hypothetical protein